MKHARIAVSLAAILSVGGLAVAMGMGGQPPANQPPGNQPAGNQPAGNQPPAGERTAGAPPRGPGGPGGREGASLEAAMKGMNRAYKQLESSIGKAEAKDDNLKAIGDLQRSIITAKGMSPKMDGIDKAKHAETLVAFRTLQIKLLKTTIELEEQVMAGKTTEAKATFVKIHDIEEEGHKQFDSQPSKK